MWLYSLESSRDFSPDFTIITFPDHWKRPHSYKLSFLDYGGHMDARFVRSQFPLNLRWIYDVDTYKHGTFGEREVKFVFEWIFPSLNNWWPSITGPQKETPTLNPKLDPLVNTKENTT